MHITHVGCSIFSHHFCLFVAFTNINSTRLITPLVLYSPFSCRQCIPRDTARMVAWAFFKYKSTEFINNWISSSIKWQNKLLLSYTLLQITILSSCILSHHVCIIWWNYFIILPARLSVCCVKNVVVQDLFVIKITILERMLVWVVLRIGGLLRRLEN